MAVCKPLIVFLQELKINYATAFEIDPKWLIEAASRRQKWIDQAQSLNLYMAQPSGKKLDALYRSAWIRGLKTTYYLRSLGATNAEKSTITDGALNAVTANSSQDTTNTCQLLLVRLMIPIVRLVKLIASFNLLM